MPKSPRLRLVASRPSGSEKRKVTVPTRKKNVEYRSREYLTEREVDRMLKAVSGRHPVRDKLAILLMYRHALRVSELLDLRWSDIDRDKARLNVRRKKNGLDTVHPIQGATMRLLRQWRRQVDGDHYVFLSERGAPMASGAVRYLVRNAGERAKIPLAVHPHMLRHGCGYYLANQGIDTRAIQEYMGHASITNTTRYTQLAANRFDGFWR